MIVSGSFFFSDSSSSSSSSRSTAVPLREHGQRALGWTQLRGHPNSHGEIRLPPGGKNPNDRRQHLAVVTRSPFIIIMERSYISRQVEKESLQTTYTENSRSMLRYVYDCVFFVARKPGDRFSDGRGDDDRHWKSPLPAKTPRREGPDSLTWRQMIFGKRK